MTQSFTVIVPARLASTRLPNKPLADIHGLPMVVRVAQRAALSHAAQVVVAADSIDIVDVCQAHGIRALLTRNDHPSGSDRLAEASALLQLGPNDLVVNVQGDEPLINPTLINQVAALLEQRPSASMSTAAHEIHDLSEFTNSNVVKVVLDKEQLALYFSRAPIPWWRDGFAQGIQSLPKPAPLRHIGIYAYRVGFLQSFPSMTPAPIEKGEALEQLRAMWHGHKIAVHITPDAPGPGVDTPEDLEKVRALLKP
ncbi:3-deoxy-manno-octulosonate cytidylyltransferase [Limnohabitans sp. MMS-10A-178]|uniref:3-deoxy-manno-octulosonate cytidylyltransferase n=1 Tax=Limnohabitans sp. MMS-10A-178 TaxID=1835767 RepID=UPI000D380DEF|nr:3-deoxy-manno-octulosonate cytidylyltransferase [Limnohabitans sp. MMS-10A-178]PUE14734.1 3-deoxy-manno-octulosonate cytidylyltransferase [Limnohabitans sp. MMS-10A-178]